MTTHLRAALLADEAAPVVTPQDGDGRTVTVRVVSWNQVERVTDDGRVFYREVFIPGGLNAPAGVEVPVFVEHDPALVGGRPAGQLTRNPGVRVGTVARSEVRPDGLYAAVRVDEGDEGDQLLRTARSQPVGVSAEFDDTDRAPGPGELVERFAAQLAGVAFTTSPAHRDARVVAVRSQHTTPPEEATTMPEETPTPPPAEPTPTPAPTPTPPAVPQPAPAEQPQHARSAPRPGVEGDQALQRHLRSFGEFAHAALHGQIPHEVVERFYRALAVGNVADIAGLVTTQYETSIINIYRQLTPAVQAFSRGPLPDKGMVVNQPIVTARPTVARQTAEGNEVSSAKVTIGTAAWSVHTYGGGQQISVQALLRSEPSYLDEIMKLYVREMAIAVDTAVALDIYAASNDVNTVSLEYTTAAAFDDLIIDASALFLDTLHRPAEIALISVDLWTALAKANDSDGNPLYPSINPQNRHGTMDATSVEGNIVKVRWYVEPALGGVGDGVKAVIGVPEAYKTLIGETGQMEADVPSTLEHDMAVFQFVAHGKVDAAGLVQVADAA